MAYKFIGIFILDLEVLHNMQINHIKKLICLYTCGGCFLPFNHRSKLTWLVEEICVLRTAGSFLKPCRPAYFLSATQYYLTLAMSVSCANQNGCPSNSICRTTKNTLFAVSLSLLQLSLCQTFQAHNSVTSSNALYSSKKFRMSKMPFLSVGTC